MPLVNTTDDVSIFYTLQGSPSNPPALLIHGWSCDSHDWSWQIPFLSSTHYVIAMDLRGHGRSNAPDAVSYSPQAHASDAASLLKHLGYRENVVVLGHSMGAIVTSVLAVQELDMVKAIVLLDAPYWTPGAVFDSILPNYLGAPNIHELTIQTYKSLMVDDTPEWMRTWYNRRVEGTPGHVISKCMEDCYGSEGVGRLEVFQRLVKGKRNCPRLAVYAKSERIEQEKALGMGELDEVVVIEGVGHWIHQVKSKEFNELLGVWLKRLERE